MWVPVARSGVLVRVTIAMRANVMRKPYVPLKIHSDDHPSVQPGHVDQPTRLLSASTPEGTINEAEADDGDDRQ